jgi:predicted nucleotidyltransferase
MIASEGNKEQGTRNKASALRLFQAVDMNERAVQRKKPTLEDLRAVRDDILRIAEKNGAGNVGIFGSVARGDAIESTDVDVLVDIMADVDGLEYFGVLEDLRRDLEDLLGRDVDIVDSAALKRMRDRVLSEAVTL